MQQRIDIELKENLGKFMRVYSPFLHWRQPTLELLQDCLVLALKDIRRVQSMSFQDGIGQRAILAVDDLNQWQPAEWLHPIICWLVPANGLESVGHALCAFDQHDLPVIIGRGVHGVAKIRETSGLKTYSLGWAQDRLRSIAEMSR